MKATALKIVRLTTVANDDVKRFRARAQECRRIADEAHSAEWRKSLLALAKDLDDEADRVQAEQAD